MQTHAPLQRIAWLDFLRGLAIFLVVAFHFTTRYEQMYPAHAFPAALPFSVPFGWMGVLLFFMISGFIIYLTIQKKERVLDFLIARLSRIMPPYWAAVLFLLAIEFLHAWLFAVPYRHDRYTIVTNALMVPDLLHAPLLCGVFWSLLVEIKFYALFALLWVCVDLKKPRTFFGSFFVLWLLVFVNNFVHPILFGMVLNYFVLFWLGIAACKVLTEGLASWKYFLLVILGEITVFAYPFPEQASLIVGIGAFSILMIACDAAFRRYRLLPRVTAPVAALGLVSYSLYLLHETLGYLVLGALAHVGANPVLAVAAATAVALLAAWIGYRGVERHDRAIARRIAKLIQPLRRPLSPPLPVQAGKSP